MTSVSEQPNDSVFASDETEEEGGSAISISQELGVSAATFTIQQRHLILSRMFRKTIYDASGCWTWIGHRDKDGYGAYSHRHPVTGGQVHVRTHRIGYTFLVGDIPSGLQMDHLCRNRSCWNPNHVEPVTFAEQMRRREQYRERLTHCNRGHEFDAQNTIIRPNGTRRCRACFRMREQNRRKTK